MKRFYVFSLLMLVFLFASAQDRTISGTVTDVGGETLPSVNVVVSGTTIGTVTDIDGKYTLKIPADTKEIVFSFVGFTDKKVAIGSDNVINCTLSEGLELEELVVTGLGIRKEKKALGYAVTTIGGQDVELKPEADVARVLRGKVPGVDITSTSGLAGSGTNVIIRGYSSITGTNQPLFVVDGVPFNTATSSDRGFTTGGATASSRFLDLDPNNIAEVSILKGLSATVLYGEAGRNGVVLVTTKNGNVGSSQKKLEVTIDQSYHINQIASLPDDQDSYGNGWQNFASPAFSNWGAPFNQPNKNGLTDGTIAHPYDRAALNDALPQYVGARYNYQAYDNLQQFFQDGYVNNTSVNVSSALGNGSSVNVNYAYLDDVGFVLNNDLKKHNFGLGANTKLANGLNVRGTFNFINSTRNTPPASPIYSSNPIDGISLFSNVLYTPRSVDLYGLEYANPVDGSSIFYRGGNDIQHPLWTANNVNDREDIRRFFGNIQVNYDLTDWLNVSYRVGLDTYTQQQLYTVNKGGRQIPDGFMQTSNRLNFITDHTLNFNYDKNFGNDWNLNGVVGVNPRRETSEYTFTNSTQQFIFDLFTHQNFTNANNYSVFVEENTIGAYFTTSLGYKSFLYGNIQARNDWTSTLEQENRSVFYPSASVSFIPTEAFGIQSNALNYLKLRVGYGTSAGYPDPYQTRNVLSTPTNVFQTIGGTTLNSNSVSNQFGNPNLKPEIHQELEVGIEGKFFNNRVGLDFSAYNKESTELIVELPLDPSTGYTTTTLNSASMVNRGIEVGLNLVPIQTKNVAWNATLNFTANEPTIESIADGVDQVLIDGLSFLGNFGIPGQPYGIIQGSKILRDEATGLPIVGANGLYQQDPVGTSVIGDPNPDWNLSFINSLRVGPVSFGMQWDYVQGGDIWASTPSTLLSRGILGETAFDRFVTVVVDGLKEDADGNLVKNDIQVTPNNHYWRDAGVWYDENRMYDGTTIRLRELSLSFDLPESALSKTPFGRASLTLSGQNLWYDAVNMPDSANFDPEVLSLGVGNGRGFDFVTGPTSKRMGASLRITF